MFITKRTPKNGGPMGGDDDFIESRFEPPHTWWNPIAWLIAIFVCEERHEHGPSTYSMSSVGFAILFLIFATMFVAGITMPQWCDICKEP